MARKGGKDRGLFERPAGSGVWWIHYHDAEGRKHRERVGPKRLANKRYMQRKTEIAEGRFFPARHKGVPLFDELLNDYREWARREGKAVMGSDIGFTRLLERFGGRRADSMLTREVEEWRGDLLEGHTPATVNRHLTLLRAILRRAVKSHALDGGTVPEIKPLVENNQRVRYLTDDEESRLIAALPDWLKPLAIVAIHTGMRKGELLNLTWDDIDFVRSVIFVRVSKSGEARRISMSATAHRTLATLWQKRRARLSARVVDKKAAGRLVFTAPQGGFIANLNRAWYPALKGADLEGLHFHDLRHTFASRLAMAHVDLNTIRVLLGHKSLAMTYRYAHFDPAYLAAAVATLDAPGPKPWATVREKTVNDEDGHGPHATGILSGVR